MLRFPPEAHAPDAMRPSLLFGELLRPVMLALPRGSTLLYRLCRLDRFQVWPDTPHRHRLFLDRDSDAWVYADVAHPIGRRHYFLGRHWDAANQLLLQALLGPGDLYVDVGANYGVLTLLASRVVGSTGLVLAVEPHPATRAVLDALLVLNRVSNCRTVAAGLGDAVGTLVLHTPGDEAALATFRPLAGDAAAVEVPVVTGDSLLADLPLDRRVLVKVDVEGFEHRVVRGFRRLLGRRRVWLAVEVTPAWLEQTGTSARALFAALGELGFAAYRMGWRRRRGRRRLVLAPLAPDFAERQLDVLFARPDEIGAELVAAVRE